VWNGQGLVYSLRGYAKLPAIVVGKALALPVMHPFRAKVINEKVKPFGGYLPLIATPL
jgi:hypothetical protein